MKAMVLAAGLGTRLRPLTYEITKPMVPVLDGPVMEHILDLLERHGFDEVIANLHYFPTRSASTSAIGSATGSSRSCWDSRGVRACRDFFGGEPFLVISGDALTDIDLGALAARHAAAGGSRRSPSRSRRTREYGVVLHDDDGRITGFQEKPAPRTRSRIWATASSASSPGDLRLFPRAAVRRLGPGCLPALLENDVPFHIHEIDEYWNDVGSLTELRQGTFDALGGELHLEIEGSEVSPGVTLAGGTVLPSDANVEGPSGSAPSEARRRAAPDGPIVIGDGARIGDGAQLRSSIVLPGTEIGAEAILIDAIAGHKGIIESLRRRG